MSGEISYSTVAGAYVSGVRALFAPASAPARERGEQGPVSYTDLATQALRLSSLSANLTVAAATQLASIEPVVRTQAETQLLAKALTDLDVSWYLVQAAIDEEAGIVRTPESDAERSGTIRSDLEQQLNLLLEEPKVGLAAIERGGISRTDLPAVRHDLTLAVKDTLAMITEQAEETITTALTGLAGLGMAEFAQAIGIVGMDLATALGQAAPVTHFYELVLDFVCKAYDALWVLLGPQVAKMAGEQVTIWLEKFKEGEQINQLLEMLYETAQTNEELRSVVATSKAGVERYVVALEQLDNLGNGFRQKTSLINKMLPKVKFLRLVPAVQFPMCTLLLAASYIVITAYVVLAGADCVGAERVGRLNRIPGVRRVVIENLLSA